MLRRVNPEFFKSAKDFSRCLNTILVGHAVIHEDQLVLLVVSVGFDFFKPLMDKFESFVSSKSDVCLNTKSLKYVFECFELEGLVVDNQHLGLLVKTFGIAF